ncbi:MAG: hypothetical protein H0X31_00270 [Nostocaceae cyanobacterium]|nr:hypothetical protein [Nostocaceae cyanobacterium]
MWWKLSFITIFCTLNILADNIKVSAQSINSNLTCNYPLWQKPPSTDVKNIVGSEVSVNIGVNRDLGGVGVQFDLINNNSPQSPVGILEARSAAGSGWQTSFLLTDQSSNRIIVFNQASGNSINSQWGYGNTFSGLAAVSYNPIVSDHYHPDRDFSRSVATSPCLNPSTGYLFEDGRLHIGTGTVQTSFGSAITITNQYTLRSRYDQYWQSWTAEQAFYIDKQIASQGNMRVYLRGYGNTWLEGPIQPFNSYNIVHASSGSCNSNQLGCSYQTDNLSYAVFVWNILGKDIGIAVHRGGNPFYANLNMVKTGISSCFDPANHHCGSIDWHTVITNTAPISIPLNSERSYDVTYYVGTIQQLASLGFTIQ